jgi:succinate-acetate transporter protein
MSEDGKGWANPAPAGLVALAIACFTFYALLSGTVKTGALPLLGCWLIGGFVVQFVVGVVELMEGNSTGGNVFLFFSAFFMLVGGLEFFVKYFAAANKWSIPLDTHIDGWAWLAIAIALFFWAPAYFKGTSILALAVVVLEIGVILIAGMDIGWLGAAFKPLAAYCLLITGILALYLSSAIILNTAYGKTILPISGPWVK